MQQDDRALESGSRVDVPSTLQHIAALVAAEGDLKLVAEETKESEAELLLSFLTSGESALSIIKAAMLLSTLRVMSAARDKLVDDIDDLSPSEASRLFLGLLTGLSALKGPDFKVETFIAGGNVQQLNYFDRDQLAQLVRSWQ